MVSGPAKSRGLHRSWFPPQTAAVLWTRGHQVYFEVGKDGLLAGRGLPFPSQVVYLGFPGLWVMGPTAASSRFDFPGLGTEVVVVFTRRCVTELPIGS